MQHFYKAKPKLESVFLALFSIILLFISGCAINKSTVQVDQHTNISNIKYVYIVKIHADERGVYGLIASRLEDIGIKVTFDDNEKAHSDAVLTYEDKWMWDITMYMVQLTVNLRDKDSNFPIASANSMHTSLTRKKPEEMVSEVIDNLFKGYK